MKPMSISKLFSAFALLALAACLQARAQTPDSFPNKLVRIVVGFPAGGSSDVAARIIAERMSNEWNSPVIVDNRVGAGGTIASGYVAAAAPDGYTLLLIGPGTHGVSSAMYKNLSYEPIKSFSSISQVARGPYFVLVNSSSNIHSIKDLLALAKASPGQVSFASTGKGSGAHYVGESIARAAGVQMLHVPYNGAAPATLALLSGQVNMAITDMSSTPNIASGKLRALAVTTPERSPLFKDIPTLIESGVPVEYTVSVGLVAPAGTPPAVIRKIHDSVVRALDDEAARKRLELLGFDAKANSPEEFAANIAGDVKKFAVFVEQAGLKQQ